MKFKTALNKQTNKQRPSAAPMLTIFSVHGHAAASCQTTEPMKTTYLKELTERVNAIAKELHSKYGVG